MLRLFKSQGNSDKIRAGFHPPLNFQSCSCLSEDSTQAPWNPTRGPSELQPGSSCQTSLGRLAVKLKRSWFNMVQHGFPALELGMVPGNWDKIRLRFSSLFTGKVQTGEQNAVLAIKLCFLPCYNTCDWENGSARC